MLKVKPVDPNAVIRDPQTRRQLPAEGAEVPDNNFWRRRLRSYTDSCGVYHAPCVVLIDAVPAAPVPAQPVGDEPIKPLTTR
jgi:hypothetical protein